MFLFGCAQLEDESFLLHGRFLFDVFFNVLLERFKCFDSRLQADTVFAFGLKSLESIDCLLNFTRAHRPADVDHDFNGLGLGFGLLLRQFFFLTFGFGFGVLEFHVQILDCVVTVPMSIALPFAAVSYFSISFSSSTCSF